MSLPRCCCLSLVASLLLITAACGRASAPVGLAGLIQGEWSVAAPAAGDAAVGGSLSIGAEQIVLQLPGAAPQLIRGEQIDLDPRSGAGRLVTPAAIFVLLPGRGQLPESQLGPGRLLQLHRQEDGAAWTFYPAETVAVAEAVAAVTARLTASQPAPVLAVEKRPLAQSTPASLPASAPVASGPAVAFLAEVDASAAGLRGDARLLIALAQRPDLVQDAWQRLAKKRRYAVLQAQLVSHRRGDELFAATAWEQWSAFTTAYRQWHSTL